MIAGKFLKELRGPASLFWAYSDIHGTHFSDEKLFVKQKKIFNNPLEVVLCCQLLNVSVRSVCTASG